MGTGPERGAAGQVWLHTAPEAPPPKHTLTHYGIRQFHKLEWCKPLCIYYLQKPQPFSGSILPPIWIQLQNRHPKSLGQPEEKEMGKPRPLWAQSTSFGWASPTHLIADRLFKMSLLQAAALKFLYPLKSGPLSHPYSSTDQNLWPGQKLTSSNQPAQSKK